MVNSVVLIHVEVQYERISVSFIIFLYLARCGEQSGYICVHGACMVASCLLLLPSCI